MVNRFLQQIKKHLFIKISIHPKLISQEQFNRILKIQEFA